LSSVTVESANPIAISSGTFSNRANATLYVPVGSEAAYEAADYWKEFKEIVEGTAPKELAYAVYDNGTLTFKYGYFTPDGTTSWDASNTGNDSSASPAWKFALGENGMWVDKVTKVVFDPSFADARPKTCFAWFDCFRKLETIEGLKYLNTSEVTSMAWMFEACMNLTSLDLINFNTSNVTDMSNMFAGAVGMTTLDLSSFNTANVTSTQCMFAGSESQTYGGPNKLKTIYVGDDWTTANVTYSDRMFECCPNLVGGNGTKFSAEHIDKTYACIDAPGTPGYLSKKGQTTTTSWAVTSTEDIPAGTKYELDDITVTIGQDGAPSFMIDTWSPYNETFANRIVGNEVNGDKEGGTFYLFTPKKNGNLTVVVRQGKTKKFYVEESGRVMDAFNGILPETEEDVYIGTYTIPVSANLTYKIYCAGSKMGFYGFTFVGRNDADKTNITFADEKVKALCVANWDTNGNGELSQAEAAAVTTLGDVFKENRDINSFDELRFFTGLTELTLDRFYTCDKMKSITIPSGVSYIDGGSFGNCSDLEYISVDPGNTTYDSRLNCNAIIEKASCKLVVGCQTTVIPDGVTAIGKDAFWGRWSMSNMNLPESVKAIGSDAFAYCTNLENIILPSSLETIELGAFTYSRLKSITLPEGLTTIGESAFDECENLTEVKVLNPVPLALTNAETFSNRANATLYVPVGCKAAYEAASIWKDFKKIVESGWAVTSTDEIPAGTKVELDDITMTIGQAGSPNFKVDPTYGAYNDTFKNPIIGNEVNGDKEGGTFYLFTPKKNGNLTVVVRQNVGNQKKFYVEESGWVMDAFNGILPETENGIYVGPYTIPVFANLTYKIYCAGSKMGFYGFTFEGRDDAEWTNIAFADEKVKALCVANWDTNGDGELSQTEAAVVESLGEVFYNNNEITSFNELRFFTGLKDMSGWVTLYGCHSLKTIIIPAGVISLDGATLAGCDALEQISVDPANTVYDSRMGCNGVIETATNKLVVGCINTIIPDNVTTIGNEAFHGRGLLTWIAIPESVTEFEDGAFAWCGSLEDIKIPSGLKTIGGWAFNHTALRSITLPEGLTTIGESAFDRCDNLTEVKVLNPVPLELINAETFSNQANATLYVPNKSITAYKEANIWKDFKGVLGLFTNQIYSDDMTAYLGCSTEMVINMDNEEEYTAYQFDLVLPQGFSLEKDENDKFVLTKGNRYPSNRSITITPHDGNIYRFVSVSMKNDVITGNSGALMTVSLVANENLEKKNYTAEIQNVVLTKTDESQLNAKSSTISITTKEVLMGDSNDDGTLNVTDAVVSVNNILGRPSATFNKVQADINRDRIVDIFDVILGLNLIRNNAVRADRLMSRAAEATSDKLSISDFTIASGDTKQLQIELTNEAAYIGFQFDLFLPEGITLTGYSVNSARVPEEIEVDMEQTDGCYRFVGVGLGTETISGTSGNIISITVKADENLKGRNLTGYLREVKLSKLDGTGTTNAETPFQITNTTSGDLSGNGSLGPEDVSALVDLIMSDTYEAKADLNGDDKVNAVDLVLLTNLVNQK
jgi:surface protein